MMSFRLKILKNTIKKVFANIFLFVIKKQIGFKKALESKGGYVFQSFKIFFP